MGSPTKRDFPTNQQLDEGMDTQMRIFVPSTYDFNKKLSATAFRKRIEETVNYFTRLLGGSTRYAGIGSYTDESGVVVEPVAVVEVFSTTKNWNRHDETVKRWLMDKKKSWGQNSMGFEWQQELIYV